MTSSTNEPKRSKKDRRNNRKRKKQANAQAKKDKLIKQPPKGKQAKKQAKKDKPVKPPPVEPLNHGTDLLSSTFEVLVGTGRTQQTFAVHEQVATKRPEFFRVGRQKRPNQKNVAKIMLLGEDPHAFSVYLHTVYFGAEHLKKLVASGDFEDSNSSRINYSIHRDDSEEKAAQTAWFLADLYLLADRLLDPITTNLVIDELNSFLDTTRGEALRSVIGHIYASTSHGHPLRRLVRDLHVHDLGPSWPSTIEIEAWTLPYRFLQDIVTETCRLQEENPSGTIEEVFSDFATEREDHYHVQ